jgi:hypothetical protein
MLPELLEFVNERILQLVERREYRIGEVLAQMPEDLLSGVRFRTLGRQIERMHAGWPPHLTTAMTARTVFRSSMFAISAGTMVYSPYLSLMLSQASDKALLSYLGRLNMLNCFGCGASS